VYALTNVSVYIRKINSEKHRYRRTLNAILFENNEIKDLGAKKQI